MPSSLELNVAAAIESSKKPKKRDGSTKSHTATLLVSLFGWGVISAALGQRIAEAVVFDIEASGGEAPGNLHKLASLGASGMCSRNCRRDLWRWLRPELASLPEPLGIRVAYAKSRSTARHLIEYLTLPVMLPNLLLETIYQSFPEYFQTTLGQSLDWFWSQVHLLT